MTKSIALVAYRSTHGGSIKMLVWLANALSKYYKVIYVNFSDDSVFYKLVDEVEVVEFSGKTKIRKYALLCNFFKERNVDLVINFGDRLVYFLAALKNRFGYRFIVSQRIVIPERVTLKRRIKYDLAYGRADCIVSQTNEIGAFFDRKAISNIKKAIIPNPVIKSARISEWENSAGNRLLCMSRVYLADKRQDLLVDAMPRILETYPDCELDFYGGDVDNNLKLLNEKIQKSGLDKKIHYKGVTDNVYSTFLNYDLLVLPSEREGISNTLLEGMLIGIPIVAADSYGGGAKLLLGDNERGLVVRKGSPDDIAKAVIECFKDRNAALERAHRAKLFVETEFSEEKVLEKWRNLVESSFV